MSTGGRVLVIGLDGFEISYVDTLMAAGEMPHLAALKERSAAFLLDNPPGRRTGLEWEQFAAGLPSERFERESPIAFDSQAYSVIQHGVITDTFLKRLDARTVVFDTPYVDLERSPNLRGIVAWGAHDAGTSAMSRPPTLIDEVGPYPAEGSIYGLSWPSPERTRATGEAYVAGAKARADATVRLMTDLVPDWEVFVVVTGELHSASEAMWHGIDPDHPIHDHPSAPAAKQAMDDAYRAVDDLVGKAVAAAGPDTHVVAFNMGGMGPNAADLPTMLLLPELLYRWSYGSARLKPRADWADVSAVPILRPDETWERAVLSQLPAIGRDRHFVGFARRLPRPLRNTIHRLRRLRPRNRKPKASTTELKVDWMPAAQYAECWSGMDAFALPAYYQGRVRVNLEGREAQGRVPLERLDAMLDEIEALLLECRDPRTGEGVVAGFERRRPANPLDVPVDHADLLVSWTGTPTALEHPELGVIGPVPFRRTGGHTGLHGFCFVSGPGIQAHDYEHRSAFDVAPTVAALSGSGDLDGTPLVTLPEPVS